MNKLKSGALVVYKNQPGLILALEGKRVLVELRDKDPIRVRPKDIVLLHPGPIDELPHTKLQQDQLLAAWELLEGEETTLQELTDLVFEQWTAEAAWAIYQLLLDGLYFTGQPDKITVNSPQEVEAETARRQAKVEEEGQWQAFLEHVGQGHYQQDEKRYLLEVADLALGKSEGSRVLAALGQKENPETAHGLLLKLGFWDETLNPYPTRAGAPASAPTAALPDLAHEERLDLTHLKAFAIDDQGSRDPDDAISLEGSRLWVHIADAAALVKRDSPAETEARARGANLYLPEGTIPMLPPAATERLALGLDDLSPALSFGIELDQAGSITSFELLPSWIKVTRLTYEEAERQLDDFPLKDIYDNCKRLHRRRLENGAVEIELPEVRVRLIDGEVVINPLPPLRSRDLVREAMLAAGSAIGHYVREHGIPIPFTSQEPPTQEIAAADSLSAMFALRRTMKPSQFTNSPAPHAGLGLDLYVQATSPLRRYLDLIVHQQLRAFLAGQELLGYQDVLQRLGAAEAVKSDLRWIERQSNEHWKLVFLQRNPGWRGQGVVVENHGRQALVLIPDLALETRIYQQQPLPLDQQLDLELTGVDLPRLSSHFRIL